jgi:hypothetical protein
LNANVASSFGRQHYPISHIPCIIIIPCHYLYSPLVNHATTIPSSPCPIPSQLLSRLLLHYCSFCPLLPIVELIASTMLVQHSTVNTSRVSECVSHRMIFGDDTLPQPSLTSSSSSSSLLLLTRTPTNNGSNNDGNGSVIPLSSIPIVFACLLIGTLVTTWTLGNQPYQHPHITPTYHPSAITSFLRMFSTKMASGKDMVSINM